MEQAEFSRTITFPGPVNDRKTGSTYVDGVLTLSVGKYKGDDLVISVGEGSV